mmetsp:Transcript_78344/g.127071  ORF Transcript_78344/g.127071 Transcript_78344/m.127071 type:complete len:195 (+) Transcript_78344:180-764(+)
MGNAQAINIAQCCCESRTDAAGMQNSVLLAPKVLPKEEVNLYGVGLVFRTTRDGKMVVSSFVKDSSAYECGLVRDGDILCAVQGQNVDTLRMEAIHRLLLGQSDSWVQMRFLRQTDAKASTQKTARPVYDHVTGEAILGQGPTDTVWASSKMRSFAPTYDSIVVDLCRKTPSNILSEAASQAQEEAMSTKVKRR